MKPFLKFIVVISIIPLLICLYFFDNIKGYYRFKQYCEKEGGLRIYESLEKNVGWLAFNEYDARAAAIIDHVMFVRYTEKGKKMYEINYLGGDFLDDNSYKKSEGIGSQEPLYKWVGVSEVINDETRLARYGYKVVDIESDLVLATYYAFKYEKFNRDKTPLDMSMKVFCPDIKDGAFEGSREWKKNFSEAFKKL